MISQKDIGLCRGWQRCFVLSMSIAHVSLLSGAEANLKSRTALDRDKYHPVVTISGNCTDERGTPVADAEIRLYARYANREKENLLITTWSDENGMFDLGSFAKPGLPGVHYGRIGQPNIPIVPVPLHVVLLKTGMATQAFTLPCKRPNQLKAVFQPGAKLEGRVIGPAGNPVTGAKVSLVGFSRMDDIASAVTDSDGHFMISDLPPFRTEYLRTHGGFVPREKHGLAVEHPDFGFKQEFYSQCPGRVDIQLEEPAIIRGTVFHADGRPAAGVTVAARATENERRKNRSGRAVTTTDDQGTYGLLLQGVREIKLGVYDNRFAPNDARRKRALSAIEPVEVNPGSVHNVPALRLPENHFVSNAD